MILHPLLRVARPRRLSGGRPHLLRHLARADRPHALPHARPASVVLRGLRKSHSGPLARSGAPPRGHGAVRRRRFGSRRSSRARLDDADASQHGWLGCFQHARFDCFRNSGSSRGRCDRQCARSSSCAFEPASAARPAALPRALPATGFRLARVDHPRIHRRVQVSPRCSWIGRKWLGAVTSAQRQTGSRDDAAAGRRRRGRHAGPIGMRRGTPHFEATVRRSHYGGGTPRTSRR